MKSSEVPRNTIARKPSHFGSYRYSPCGGSSSASFASIGSTGGAIGKSVDFEVCWLTMDSTTIFRKPSHFGSYRYSPCGGSSSASWDGLRAIVFRGTSELFIQSRDLRPFDRYFPELHDALLARLPKGCVLDGEIVIATKRGLDFDARQMRLHPAESRVMKLAKETPSSFVAFDLLAVDGENLMAARQSERRSRLDNTLVRIDRKSTRLNTSH